MTLIDVEHLLFETDTIRDHIKNCRKNHKKIDPVFLMKKGKSIMDYAYQCHCFSKGKIPVCGVYEI